MLLIKHLTLAESSPVNAFPAAAAIGRGQGSDRWAFGRRGGVTLKKRSFPLSWLEQ